MADNWIDLPDEAATRDFAAELATQILGRPLLIYLQGDLGAGKTTLVRGILRSGGFNGPVRSPTYTLMESYELSSGLVYHFDLYRLEDPEELEFIGGRDYFSRQALCLVEWPQKAAGWLPPPDLLVTMRVQGMARQIHLQWQNSQA